MTARVVVVSESLTIRMDICEALEAAGFEVRPCPSLEAARAATSAESCGLVLVDLAFSTAETREFLREHSTALGTRRVPLMLLASEAEVEASSGLGLGEAEYVSKPYDLPRLIERARELTRPAPAPRASGRHVVVVDDSPTYRNQLTEALEAADYRVDGAASGEEGLALVTRVRPDAVIVDGVLPGIDGATVVRRLKSDSAFRSTPCLLLTATEAADDELRSLEAGADAYVHKSEDLAVILAKLSALLRHARSSPEHVGESIPSLLRAKRLLAVDDSLTYLTSLGDELRKEGHDVVLARSGEEALEVLAREPVDCILLDLVMPGLSGHETCRLIKQAPEWRDIPLVMLTARDDREAMIEGINAGADDYIAKSADFDVLKARLRAQLRRKHFEDENRRIRERLVRREAEARFQSLLHSNIIGVIFGDVDGHLADANDAFLGMLGYSRADLEAGVLRSDVLTPPEWRGRDAAAVSQLRATGSVAPFAKEFYRKDGSRLPIVLGLVLLEGSSTTVGFVLDRTEQKRAEEKIRDYTLALEGANRELALAKEQAEQTSQYKSSFLANMSHELRTPLNAIIGFAELLYDGQVQPDMPEHKEFLGDILTSGRHLLQLINDVLDLSKVEAGKLEFHPEQVVLPDLVREVLTVLRTSAVEKNIRVEIELAPDLAEVFVDPARLKQVLYNYVSNALKFTPSGGKIFVRAESEGVGTFRLVVEDTGVGIAAEDVSRLFAEFEQLDGGTAKKHGGTGLGLALTKRLVESQGGTVGVRSTRGAGSSFYAVLPCRKPEPSLPPRPPLGQLTEDRTVLVVDDDAASAKLMAATLQQLGYRALCVPSAAEGLLACEAAPPAAVVLDLMLPGTDGFGFLEAFRRMRKCESVPVILWTSADLSAQDYERLGGALAVVHKGRDLGTTVKQEIRAALSLLATGGPDGA